MTILVATDFSDGSVNAVEFAAMQPAAHDGLVVMHTIDAFDDELWALLAESPSDLEKRLLAETSQRMEKWTDDTLGDSKTATKKLIYRVTIGAAPVEIPGIAAEKGASRIVCGSTGMGRVTDFLVGATAIRIARHSDLPVTIIRTAVDYVPKTFVVPYDFSERCNESLKYAYERAKEVDGSVYVIHSLPGDESFALVEDGVEYRRTLLDGRRQRLDEVLSEAPVDTLHEFAFGAPHKAILDAADRHPDSEIIIASHNRGPVGRIALGSVTERVLRSAKSPVTVL